MAGANSISETEDIHLAQARFDVAVQASKIGLWDFDVASGDLWWSQRFKDIVGATDQTFQGRIDDFVDRLHPDDKDRIMGAVQSHLEDQVPYDVRYRLRHADGHYLLIEAKGQATWNDKGEPLSMIGTVDDVTERDRHYAELVESNAQLALAARLSGLGHWRIDLVNNTIKWSEQIYAIHGVAPNTYTPDLESAINFYHPDDVERVSKHVADAIENAAEFEFEARLVRPSGEIRVVKSIGHTATNAEGRPTSVFGVFIDVTEDRLREEELRGAMDQLSKSNEELNRFSYVCSHDMKEPVRLIQSLCELLMEPDIVVAPNERDELIERISVNTNRLAAIISSLLAYSRVEGKVEAVDVDLNEVLTDVKEGLALSINERNAEVAGTELPVLHGARVHYSQLFQNLISNALKFNDKPLARVHITSTQRPDGGMEIRVDDNGPGIPCEHRDSVFQVFKRLQSRDEIDGTGLGLSICQRIVKQYGGEISAEESPDLGGASFVVNFGADAPSLNPTS